MKLVVYTPLKDEQTATKLVRLIKAAGARTERP